MDLNVCCVKLMLFCRKQAMFMNEYVRIKCIMIKPVKLASG